MDAVIIGMGHMGHKHAETLTAAGHRILATADTDEGAKLALNYKADIAVIASPDHCHALQSALALFNGMHVFCEKPLAVGRSQLEDLLDVYAMSGKKLMCHFPLRYVPEVRRLHMQRHEAGKPYAVNMGYQWGRLSNLKNGWRGQNPHYSIVMGGMIHMLDLAQWFVGAEIEPHSAIGVNTVWPEFPGPLFVRALFKINGTCGDAFADFSYDGVHRHILQLSCEDHDLMFENTEEAPKEPALQDFLACIIHDRDTGIDGMVSAHRAALEIDRMARAA